MHFSIPNSFPIRFPQKYFVLFQTYELGEGKSERYKLHKQTSLIGSLCDVATKCTSTKREGIEEIKR